MCVGQSGSTQEPRARAMRYDEPGGLFCPARTSELVLSFGNRTQNSRVAGARLPPNHQPIGDLEPTQGGVCVFITAVSITNLFAWGQGKVEDMCYEGRRAEAYVD